MDNQAFVELYEKGYGEERISKTFGISVHEARKKILELGLKKHVFSRKGAVLDEEIRNKIRKSHLGKTLSKEHRDKVIRTLVYGQKGKDNKSWKGGISMHGGYVIIKMPEHPKSYQNGYVKKSVLVLEEKIGRHLMENEVSHHINGIKTDDRPENLEVLTASQHNSITAKERWLSGEMKQYHSRRGE